MDFAKGISRLFVIPEGSNREWLNLSQRTLSGTPYCSVREMAVAKESISPETTDPCLAIVTKISPGDPSSYIPTVMYPSWPAIENLCVIDWRSSGRRRRRGRYDSWTCAGSSFREERGWLFLQPSRYRAIAFSPSLHPSMYVFSISSTVACSGRLTV